MCVYCMYYLTFLSQLFYILISIIPHTYPNYPTYLVIYPTYPLHARLQVTYEVAGNTTRVVYVCSVCDKAFGDIHSSCAKHVNGRGACKAKGAVVLQLPINFSRNDRNVGGRLGLQHGFGRLAAPGQAGDSDMVGGGPPSPARAPVSGIHTYTISLSICILHTHPNYPSHPQTMSYGEWHSVLCSIDPVVVPYADGMQLPTELVVIVER